MSTSCAASSASCDRASSGVFGVNTVPARNTRARSSAGVFCAARAAKTDCGSPPRLKTGGTAQGAEGVGAAVGGVGAEVLGVGDVTVGVDDAGDDGLACERHQSSTHRYPHAAA